MADDTPQTRVIEHRGRRLQVHIAPRAGDASDAPHVHVQDLAGGAGQIVRFDDPLALELADEHPELEAIGYEGGEAFDDYRERRGTGSATRGARAVDNPAAAAVGDQRAAGDQGDFAQRAPFAPPAPPATGGAA